MRVEVQRGPGFLLEAEASCDNFHDIHFRRSRECESIIQHYEQNLDKCVISAVLKAALFSLLIVNSLLKALLCKLEHPHSKPEAGLPGKYLSCRHEDLILEP